MLKTLVRSVALKLGYRISRVGKPEIPLELETDELSLVDEIQRLELSMVPPEGLFAVMLAAKHLLLSGQKGNFVECGVWRGGASICIAYLLSKYKFSNKLFLFDTFAGMTMPSELDTRISTSESAIARWTTEQSPHGGSTWCNASLEEVKGNFQHFNLLSDQIIFIKGDVSITLKHEPVELGELAFLRLDTDWYESTKIELRMLYPRLVQGGIAIIDDYGNWSGSKLATDEFLSTLSPRPFLHRIYGDSGRLLMKLEKSVIRTIRFS